MLTITRRTSLALVFFSGASGLIYEMCWSKRLANWLGNTGQAHAILLATFMGGLALGAWLFGTRADRTDRPLRLYGVLELAVGVLALLFPFALELAGRVYLQLGSGGGNVARLALAAVTVLPPAVLMGGSLPAMTRALTGGLESAKGTLASVYAVNSGGAAIGSLLAGVLFVPSAGLAVTERFAVGINLTVGVLALLARPFTADQKPGSATSDEPVFTASPQAVTAVLVTTALSGFTGMLYEVTWIRVLSIIIGGTSYAFTLIVSVFILGIALGSRWIARRGERNPLQTLGWLQLSLVVVIAGTVPLYQRLPFVFFQLTQLLRPDTAWSLYLFLTFVFCGALLIPPTFLMGASFPLAGRVLMQASDRVGRDVGRAYLFNTVGTIAGSLLGGLLLLPLLGLEGNFAVGLAANVVGAFVVLNAAEGPKQRALVGVMVVALITSVAWVGTRGWATFISEAGRYREWQGHFTRFDEFAAQARSRAKTTFYADDVFASVLVAEQAGGHRVLRINGKADGSNGRGDVDTQMLAAHLGVLTHPGEVKKVLLVGVGAGITAGSLLAYPLERLDVVEISPAVLEAARQFSPDNRAALDDPRCHVHLEDARTFLALSEEKYDLIVSVPSNPWVTGVAGLFTTDFFQLAHTRLNPGGRLVQWIHAYESNEQLVRMVVRTLRGTFEHGTTWLGTSDLLLIASADPQVIDVNAIETRMRIPAVAEDLRRLDVTRATTLLARQVHGDGHQRAFGGEGPLNTDDHNRLEYLSPIAYFAAAGMREMEDERLGLPGESTLAFTPYSREHPLDAEAWAELRRALLPVHTEEAPVLREVSERWLQADPTSDAAKMALAQTLQAQGDFTRASALLGDVPTEEARALRTSIEARLGAQRAPGW